MNSKEEFLGIVEEFKQNKIIVIVEGKKDAAALRQFGLNNILELSKKPLFAVVEEVSDNYKECAILTDLDKKGKELYGKLNRDLSQRGIKINDKLRNFLYRNTKIRQIEGLRDESLMQ